MSYITQETAMKLAAELDAQNGRHAPLLHALCNAAIKHYLDSAPLLSHYVQSCIEDDRRRAELAQPAEPVEPDCRNVTPAEDALLRSATLRAGKKIEQPDCRTCVFKVHGKAVCMEPTCTNGDQYVAAPRVVLWRTE